MPSERATLSPALTARLRRHVEIKDLSLLKCWASEPRASPKRRPFSTSAFHENALPSELPTRLKDIPRDLAHLIGDVDIRRRSACWPRSAHSLREIAKISWAPRLVFHMGVEQQNMAAPDYEMTLATRISPHRREYRRAPAPAIVVTPRLACPSIEIDRNIFAAAAWAFEH